MIDILLPAFCVSVVLLGIHSYFGLQIIERGIIFTDLAIGQMAAFGAAVSLLAFHGEYMYLSSLSFAILGGLMISIASRVTKNLEAVIGLMYSLGISGAFILLSNSAHGMEEFHKLMAYDILFTRMEDIYKVAMLYMSLGVAIYFFNKKTTGLLKETLFFLTFAATVTSSVKIAGVLVVFAILLSPALITLQIGSKSFCPKFIKRFPLITAWIIGTIINICSIFISYNMDLPTGYTLVFMNSFFAVGSSFALRPKIGSENQEKIYGEN